MKDLVCIDTMIGVWSIKKISSPGQENMIPLTTALMDKLTKDKKQVLLPAPVITELLAPVDDPEEWNAIQTVLNTDFRVGALDARAAVISAKIWHDSRNDWKEIYEPGGDGIRNRFKFDTLVLGVAIANKVECLYTADDRLCKLAHRNGLETYDIIKQGLPHTRMQLPLQLPR